MPLKRKPVYLDVESERRIRMLAKATGLSQAEHIRRAIADYVSEIREAEDDRHPLLEMIGICGSESGPRDSAVRHDKYLYGKKG